LDQIEGCRDEKKEVSRSIEKRPCCLVPLVLVPLFVVSLFVVPLFVVSPPTEERALALNKKGL